MNFCEKMLSRIFSISLTMLTYIYRSATIFVPMDSWDCKFLIGAKIVALRYIYMCMVIEMENILGYIS